MRRRVWVVLGVVALAAAAGAIAIRRKSNEPDESLLERRSEPDPDALQAILNGAQERFGLDLEVLQKLHPDQYEPLVEYLTYIQVQRGENSSLVFVRERDIDSLATMVNESREIFLEKFQKLGVMLSMN